MSFKWIKKELNDIDVILAAAVDNVEEEKNLRHALATLADRSDEVADLYDSNTLEGEALKTISSGAATAGMAVEIYGALSASKHVRKYLKYCKSILKMVTNKNALG